MAVLHATTIMLLRLVQDDNEAAQRWMSLSLFDRLRTQIRELQSGRSEPLRHFEFCLKSSTRNEPLRHTYVPRIVIHAPDSAVRCSRQSCLAQSRRNAFQYIHLRTR
jgi:hypothetical protein